MFSTVLALASTFVEQVSTVLLKKAENNEKNAISAWETSLVSLIGSSIIVFYLGGNFITTISLNTFSTVFLARVILEVGQFYVTYKGLHFALLSNFNFVRVTSIVVALILEITLIGTVLHPINYFGVLTITLGILYLYRKDREVKKGMNYLILSAISGGILNTLAKYQYLNDPVYTIESQVRLIVTIIVMIVVISKNIKQPQKLLTRLKSNKGVFLTLPFRAMATFFSITAINYSNATSYVAIERGGSVLFGIILGRQVFKEKALSVKIVTAILISLGIYLISIK